MQQKLLLAALLGMATALTAPVGAQVAFDFITGSRDGKIATGARIPTPGKIQIETGDDFLLTAPTRLVHATFTGLLIGGATIGDISDVNVDLYHVFPKDSDTARTITV